ncbi:amidase [Gaiella sp.]|uniref:amidase n=1 Tax=Gaiella sp. TaxID=2663207 RepID=UPI002CFB21A1|nr:amidase [Gaiella sp.]HWO80419.1 amidase [Gaiella sp.]
MTDLARLGVVELSGVLQRREASASEVAAILLERIRNVDGTHSHEGDSGSINAWVRVYEEDALAAAARADERLSEAGVRRDGPAPALTGVPIGLKDLYAVAGKPVTASSTLLHDVPTEDCDPWRRLSEAGMVLLGHLHTHEFAAGGTTDQVGSPWALDRSAGGSSGGSGAALAARMTPAATGTDTAGSLRIPSACCGTSTIKPTRATVSLAGVVPLSWSLDHAGPMARTLADCAVLLEAMAGPDRRRAESALHASWVETGGPTSLEGSRVAVSPRLGSVDLDPDVAAGFERALEECRRLGATIVEPPSPGLPDAVGQDFVDVLTTEMLVYHRRFDAARDAYRPSLREWVETGERRAMSGEEYVAAQERRKEATGAWSAWLAEHRVDALLEPTIPVVAPLRGEGYDHAGTDYALISLTHLWDWTGLPVAAIPSGVGGRTGLPVGVSLVGPAGTDGRLLALGVALQAELGIPEPPGLGLWLRA